MEIIRYIRSAQLSACGASDVGRVRKANEDNCGYARVPAGELFVVCDGMGGHVGGATASRIAVDTIIGHMAGIDASAGIPRALSDALKAANSQVLATAAADSSLRGMGTTACIVLVRNGEAYIAHVGDSRIYLFDGNDRRLHRITKDHSLVQQLVDNGDLDDREAEHHPQKNIILAAIGIRPNLSPDAPAAPIRLVQGDRILICSDGLSGMVGDEAIEEELRSGKPTDLTVSALMEAANQPDKGKDNITAQLIDVLDGHDSGRTYTDHNPRWRQQEVKTANVRKITVGRIADNDFVLDRPRVSKHHLEFVQDGADVLVRDLGSLNGTSVNGYRIQGERRLQPGDAVTVDGVDLPWEDWFGIVRPRPAKKPSAPSPVSRPDVRRRVEEKLSKLKGMIH